MHGDGSLKYEVDHSEKPVKRLSPRAFHSRVRSGGGEWSLV